MSSADKQIEKIYETLKKRGEEWPERGKAWHKFNEEAVHFYSYLTNNPNFNTSLKSDFPLLDFEKTENSPIFICGNLKSGTSLLLQLSDNHENIFSMPGDSFFIKRFSGSKNININETAKYWLKRMMNPTGQEPFLPYGKSENVYQNFINFLHYFIFTDKKEIFNSVVLSFLFSTQYSRVENIKYWVEKTPLNELHTEKLSELFPKAKFINVVRDPIQNIISLKRLDKVRNRKSNMLQKALFQVFLIKRSLKNQQNIKNYKIITYENLTEETEKTMREISRFLDIKFSESLTVPTVNGISATANSMDSSKRLRGKIVKTTNNKEKLNELNKTEKIICVNILSLHKPYFNSIKTKYPELAENIKPVYVFIAKFTYFLYRIYRKTVK